MKPNLAFNRASAAQKRVMIAKDVIARTKSGQYFADTGVWAEIDKIDDMIMYDETDETPGFRDKQVQEVIVKDEGQCSCCALGGLMLSCVVFKNNVKIKDYMKGALDFSEVDSISVPINKFFSKKQLCAIEIAYEQGNGYYGVRGEVTIISEKAVNRANDFGLNCKSDYDRLLAIMNNIVKNKGTFIP